MQFKEWGEENFIQYLGSLFPTKSPVQGIGDDCAVIPCGQGEKAWLITTDGLTEGIHFLKEQISPKDLGYKSVAVNVSDIAAMGGEPKYAFLTIAIPSKMDSDWMYDLIQGIKEACDKWELLLLGGDTIGSKRDLFLNLTLIGSAPPEQIKYRHQAKIGDIICVTGYLGDSGGGLRALQEKTTENSAYLLRAHFRPNPNPQQGLWLASHKGVHAMMDISDGLNIDLSRLIKSSQKGAVIETTRLPISTSLSQTSLENGWDPLELALTGGEDYCLLVTVDPVSFKTIQGSFQEKFNLPLFSIGHITDLPIELVYHQHGEVILTSYKNFNHFQ